MTNAQKNVLAIQQFLDQHADGWVFVGFNCADGEPLTAVAVPDGKSEVAINALISGILSQGGVGALQDQIRKAQSDAQKGEEEE